MKKILLLASIFSMLFAMPSMAQDRLEIADFAMNESSTKSVAVTLNNPITQFVNFQFDLVLPQGLKLQTNSNNGRISYTRNDNRLDPESGWSVSISLVDEASNTYRFTAYNQYNDPILGTNGALLMFSVVSDAEIPSGEHTGYIKAQVLTTKELQSVEPADGTFTVSIDNTTSGIQAVGTAASNGPVYNLQGLRLSRAKGLVIKDGRKMMVK